MSQYDYDLFIIGAGSGGVRAARFAAGFGARVAIAEERFFGGTCVNIGCVPKKLMVYASHFSEDFEDAAGYGWTVGERSFDWATLIANKDREIARLNGIYKRLLDGAGVAVFEARATIVDPHGVEVGGRRVTAAHILVATGGRPVRPREPGQELGIVSDDVFHLDRLPERILIAGGGYIAVEFAGVFAGLGSRVTQIYRGPLFLRGFDADVRAFLAEEMPKKGVRLVFNEIIESIEKTSNGLAATLSGGEVLEVDQVLYAIGRQPNTANLGLEKAGVELAANGAIKVDPHYRSSVPSILAIGDVTDRIQLTPVALAEGMAVARTLFNDQPTTVDYHDVPSAVFSQPPMASVGLTEEAARMRCGAVEIYRSTFKPMKHTLSGRDEKTLMKLVVERDSQKVVGAHMVGLDAAEIVQGLAIAIKAGATKADFDRTIGIHPTAAEEFVTMREPIAEPDEAPEDAAEAMRAAE
ncbi:NADPH-glutathione reductase [Tistlia consotensis]|uniref:Glutathione reductase n=1 Tax=Tistlia consotensis USBA 355 TaxID=560819 RepID=A0A1Y6BCA5_9PROT|nr:glutathione-disulfide reductase [Tistlia consotensis]SMF00554.1 NADPH-glutathione reductase [Tistlia consotensis USBA 355]SNR75664.1 NADPH-glutathione reductase [Tistlia consotensis]